MLEEKKSRWHTFSGFGPTSFSYNARVALHPCKFGSNPCNHVCKSISNIIGKIPLQKFDKEITLKFDKTITKFQHLFHLILLISIEIKEIMGYLPLSLVVFETPPFPSSEYLYTFEILLPFLFFFSQTKKSAPSKIIDRKHVEFWHEKVMSSHFKIQNVH